MVAPYKDDGGLVFLLTYLSSVTGSRVTDGSQSRVNFVNNYYKKGPSSTVNYALRAQVSMDAMGTHGLL